MATELAAAPAELGIDLSAGSEARSSGAWPGSPAWLPPAAGAGEPACGQSSARAPVEASLEAGGRVPLSLEALSHHG